MISILEPPKPNFAVGDVVSLTCENTGMTVTLVETSARGYLYTCVWLTQNLVDMELTVPEVCLRPFKFVTQEEMNEVLFTEQGI